MKRMISLVLIFLLAVPVLAAPAGVPHVVDNAGLLEPGEQKALERRAGTLSARNEFDFVIVTVERISPASPRAYADDYYDANGYGFGAEGDGILLLVDMEDHRWWVSAKGFGITAFTDYGRERMMDEVVPYLAEGDYAGAFTEFLDQGESLLKQARAGHPVDVPEEPVFTWTSVGICLVLGFGLAFLPMSALKKQVRNVAGQADALGYAAEGGLELQHHSDRFLYSTVTRQARPKEPDASDSGGSSMHTSSSGSTHSGSGGSF